MIKFVNLTKTYGEVTAADNISFTANEAEITILKGASGSGKSTCLSACAGLIKPTSGHVEVFGKNISKLTEHFSALFRRENFGIIFQQFNLISGLSAADNVAVALIPLKMPVETKIKMVEDAMRRFSIFHKKDAPADGLSGGEKQRIALARALMNNPKILIADEPTANLDEKLKSELTELIKDINSGGTTVIIATHDPAFKELEKTSKIINLKNGRLA